MPLTLFAATAAIFCYSNAERSAAIADQVEGVYIFTDARPAGKFSFIAALKPKTVQLGTNIGGQEGLSVCELTYIQLRDDFLKQLKKKYSEANALIIYPGENRAEAIKVE